MRKSAPRRSLTKATLVSAACMSAACASAPTPRPVIPTECPPGSAETLRRFGIADDDLLRIILMPISYYIRTQTVTIQEGPWTALTLLPYGGVTSESEVQGVLFVENNRLHGRFTRLRPRGMTEDFPICMQMTYGGRLGQPLMEGSRPGKPLVDVTCDLRPRSYFY